MIELKIMPVEMCGAIGKCMASPGSYASSLSGHFGREPSAIRVADHALQQLESARQIDVQTHEKNLPAIENNKLLAEHIHALMKAIGMPTSHRQRDYKSRARFPKYITLKAGYLDDITRENKTDDSFAAATGNYERLKVDYQRFKTQAAEQDALAQRERDRAAERERQARLANVELAELILRYGIDRESDWRDVLEHLRGQHQRANLAVAMMNVRHDWNDGPDEVSNAIDAFKIETDEDKEIANSVLRNLGDGWDGDGRCFRDCSWNYDMLIASLPEPLAADVLKAYSRCVPES